MRVGHPLLIALATLTLVGCGSAESMPVPTPTPTFTSTWVAPEPTALAPLTGETVAVGALGHSALAAKIDNHEDARPQFGLERADIVFEELVEGGLSRYVAIWHSDVPEEIGPIRSIRPMDPNIISPFGGIVAYAGGQQRFVDLMLDTPVFNAIHGYGDTDAYMYRTDLKDSPHDVVVRAQQLVLAHPEIVAPVQQFGYALDAGSSTAGSDGAAIDGMDLVLGGSSTPAWRWDAATGRFVRFMTGGDPDVDAAGAQLNSVNIVVMRVPVSDDQDVPRTEMLGTGEAWVATSGRLVHATWTKAAATDRIRIVDDNGVVVRLAPGNTWVELVPLDGAANFLMSAAG